MRGLIYKLNVFIISLGLHLAVAIALLVFLMTRHQWILALHPSLFDSLSMMYFFTEWLLFLMILFLLLPSHQYGFYDDRKAEDKYRKQEEAMKWNYMESILWKLPDLFFKVTIEPLAKPVPPVEAAADVSLDDHRLKYQPPGTYPEPEWMGHKISSRGSLSTLTDAQLDAAYGRAVDDSGYPLQPQDLRSGLSDAQRLSRAKAHRLHVEPSVSPHPANRHKVDGLDHHDEIAKRQRKPLYTADASLHTFSPISGSESDRSLLPRGSSDRSSTLAGQESGDSYPSNGTGVTPGSNMAFSSSSDSLSSPPLSRSLVEPASYSPPLPDMAGTGGPMSQSSTEEDDGRPSGSSVSSRSASSRGLK